MHKLLLCSSPALTSPVPQSLLYVPVSANSVLRTLRVYCVALLFYLPQILIFLILIYKLSLLRSSQMIILCWSSPECITVTNTLCNRCVMFQTLFGLVCVGVLRVWHWHSICVFTLLLFLSLPLPCFSLPITSLVSTYVRDGD